MIFKEDSALKLIDPILGLYLRELSKISLLTPEEEKELAKKAHKDDKKARDKLIISNLRYVVHIALQYKDHGLPLCDLINEGNLGLIRAIDKYDARRRTRLLTYASWWIRYSITTALAKRKLIRLPSRYKRMAHKVRNSYQRVATKYGRDPTLEELALELNLDVKELSDAFLSSKSALSIDYTQSRSFGTDLTLEGLLESSLPSPEEEHRQRELKEEIKQILKILTYEERYIIKELFGISEIPEKVEESLRELREELELKKGPEGHKLSRKELSEVILFIEGKVDNLLSKPPEGLSEDLESFLKGWRDRLREERGKIKGFKLFWKRRLDRTLKLIEDLKNEMDNLLLKSPKSLSAIGREMGISRERVRQLKERALYKLKLHIGREDLKKLLA